MGFNRRKMEDRRRKAAEQESAARRETEKQVLEDADHLVAVWNERQAKRMPMLFSPTIGAAITAGYWFLRARCPACCTTGECRPADARFAPRRGRDGPYPGAVVSLLPAERAVRRTRLPVQVERGRGVLRRTQRQQVGQRVSAGRRGRPSTYVFEAPTSSSSAPHYLVSAKCLSGPIARKEQYKIIGNVESIEVDAHAAVRNVGDEAVGLRPVVPQLYLRHTRKRITRCRAFLCRLERARLERAHNARLRCGHPNRSGLKTPPELLNCNCAQPNAHP